MSTRGAPRVCAGRMSTGTAWCFMSSGR
jgi:hypothetical protein